MQGNRYTRLGPVLWATAGMIVLSAFSLGFAGENATPSPIPVGVSGKFFNNVPPSLAQILTGPLKKLVEKQTGFAAEVVMAADHTELGQLLEEQKVRLAVMHGFEFAWLKPKHPEL